MVIHPCAKTAADHDLLPIRLHLLQVHARQASQFTLGTGQRHAKVLQNLIPGRISKLQGGMNALGLQLV